MLGFVHIAPVCALICTAPKGESEACVGLGLGLMLRSNLLLFMAVKIDVLSDVALTHQNCNFR